MKKALLLTGLVVSSAAAIAQAPDGAPATTRIGPNGNPQQIVCINQAEIGSRLARRRVCRTRAQWEEQRLQTRETIERSQSQRPTSGG